MEDYSRCPKASWNEYEKEKQLQEKGKDVTFHIYEGTGHAFANEEDALGTYDSSAADIAWKRTVNLLNEI